MNLIKTFRIIIGVLLLVSTTTIFFLLFLEIESLAVIFNFSIDTSAENLGEAILVMVGGLLAGLMFFIAMIFVGIINAIIYTVTGVLTITLKRKKTTLIIAAILSGFVLFLEVRALIILTLGGFTSIVLPVRIISDSVIIGLSIVSFILILKEDKTPRA
jgi:hypothetical protein